MGIMADINTYWLGGKPTKEQQTFKAKGLCRYDAPPSTTTNTTSKVEPKKEKPNAEKIAKDLLWDYINKRG